MLSATYIETSIFMLVIRTLTRSNTHIKTRTRNQQNQEKTNKKKNGDGDKNLDNRIMPHERLESLGALPLVESRAYSLTFFFFLLLSFTLSAFDFKITVQLHGSQP